MTEQRYKFYDDYGRPNHHQIYLTGGETAYGAYIDTLELGFVSALSDEQVDDVIQHITDALGESQIQRIAWPDENQRLYLGLRKGYYAVKDLSSTLFESGYEIEHMGYFYSGRLGKAKASVGSQAYRRL